MSKHRVVKFGSITPLTGILTEPSSGTVRERPVVVVLNSGILHHVGANRLHVQLARRLASSGFTTLRFDFSGVGDSEPRRDHLAFEQSAPAEAREAIDYLVRSCGVREVILVGLCSGADVSHFAALQDERVVGLGLLDPWAYRTPRHYAHYYGYRLVKPDMYSRWLRHRWRRLSALLRRTPAADEQDPEMYLMPEYIRVFPPREKVANELREFVRRRIEMCFIFSGGLEEYNHQGQYRSSFRDVDFDGRLRETHVRGATHVFTALAHQEFVVRELAEWVTNRFAHRGMESETTVRDAGARTA